MKLRVPKGAFVIAKEILRHLLRRPVGGIAAAARTEDGRWLLIRRSDTGEWALPGGTLEWGETLTAALHRELLEEAGVESAAFERIVGVYSRPDRDPRFHAMTVLVTARIAEPVRPPVNPVEIREVRLFAEPDLPRELSHGMTELLDDARRGVSGRLE